MLGMPQTCSRVARDCRRHMAPDFLPAARAMCRTVGGPVDDRLRDVACGPSTAAFPARELGATRVLGVDYTRGMISTGGGVRA